MRAALFLVAALMFGVAGGYAWSAMSRHPKYEHVPKVPKTKALVIPETTADEQWRQRADGKDAEPEANTAAGD